MSYEELIKKYETPFYAFDFQVLRDRIDYIKNSLPQNTALCYAVKANTFIISEAQKHVERLEVCSEGEFEVCEALGVDMEKIVLSGVYKTPNFIRRVIEQYDNLGIYTVESISQYELLKNLAKEFDKKINVLVRLNSKNQFGVTEEDFRQILEEKNERISLKGIQYFSTTQKSSFKKLKREFDYLSQLINRIEEDYSIKIHELEYGTGSPVCYFKEESFDEEEYFEILSQLLSSLPADIKITLEMGRSIAASCGTYYSKVVDKKSNKAGNFAIIDGGMNHLVYFGQSMAMKHPYFEMYPHRADDNAELWNICGSLCTVNDILVKSLPVTNLDTGDILIFKNTGAYCMCEGISLFLSRELPAVVIDDNGNSQLVRNHFKTSQLNKPNFNLK